MSQINPISNLQTNDKINRTNNNTSKSNSDFSSYLGESSSLDSIFKKASEKYNISVNLLKSVGKAESNFNAKAVSSCGAQGVMQLMPQTAASLGVKDSFNAEDNIMGGAKYLSSLLEKYNGNTKLALAAYNAGSGNVAKYGGIPPFKETQNYVVKVMNYMNQDINADTTTKSNESSNSYPLNNQMTPNVSAIMSNQNVPTTVNKLPSTILSESLKTTDINGITQSIDDIFSYEDYLYFLNTLITNDSSYNFVQNNDEKDNSAYYASKQINYNVPVMNLLDM